MSSGAPGLGIYLHVPFCRTKCRYCDFYRVGENRLKIDLFLAALHYEKGDMQKAEAVLAAMPGCRVALLNDEKHALYARVLAAAGREKEAEAVLARMLADGKTAMARELILLQLADMQVKGKRSAEAAATLKRILSEYAETPSAMEARTLLAGIKGAGAAGQ